MGEGVVVEGCPDVLVDADGLVCSPEETAAEEGGKEEDAVVPLGAGAGHAEFVEEPVEIEEGGGELVEDECWAVEVHEGALFMPLLAIFAPIFVLRGLISPSRFQHRKQIEKKI